MRALYILAEQTENKALAEITNQVRIDVEKGASLSQALSKHPKAFSRLYIAMVKAGEIGGVLDSVLLRLADTIEKQVELRRKVKSAMTYPAVVAVLVLVIVSAMLLFIIPMFEDLYSELGGTLPVPTRILISISKFVREFWWLIFGAEAVRRLPVPALDQLRERPQPVGRPQAEGSGVRPARPQDRAGPVLPHAVGARALGCADPRVARHRRRDGREPRRRRGDARHAVGSETR